MAVSSRNESLLGRNDTRFGRDADRDRFGAARARDGGGKAIAAIAQTAARAHLARISRNAVRTSSRRSTGMLYSPPP
jgi:hypothetical protein